MWFGVGIATPFSNMDILRKLKRNPVSAAFGMGIIGCLALSSGNISKTMNSMAQVRDLAQKNNQADMLLHTSQEAASSQAEIADLRYQTGCVMVVSMNHPDTYTSLTEGQPVLDRVRKTPLPVGTVVCDANGNTARIVQGLDKTPVVGELAFTGSRQLVESVRKRHNHKYSLPNQ